MNPLRHKFLPITFAVSVLGLCFSVYNILSSFLFEKTCTSACGLFANFTIMGVSLWWAGAIFFTVILILSLFGLAYCIRILTAVALLADVFLLFVMLNTTLCLLCICAGILIACAYYTVRYENRRPLDPYPKTILLSLWTVMFILLLGSAINANQQRGISFAKAENPTTNIFFSPSCPACKKILMAEQNNKNIAWFPVEEKEHDIWRILFMQERINAGDTVYQALVKAEESKPEEKVELVNMLQLKYVVMQYKVWKNTAIVKRRTQAIPYIEVFGTPKEYKNSIQLEQSPLVQNDTQIVNALIGQENQLCGDDTKPCEEK